MLNCDGSVVIGVKLDSAEAQKGIQSLHTQFGRIGSAVRKIGLLVGSAFAVGSIIRFGKEAISLGSDLAEVQNVVDVTFGELNNEINEFSQNAITQFGLSEISAKRFTSTMGAMLKSMGFTQRQAADMGMALTGLAGDMASFYNLDAEDAFHKIRAGISGETEPLKQLGVNLSVANLEQYALTQGITKSYKAMTQQEQALLRYNYLLGVTTDAQGDFTRTSASWANQTRILSEQFNSIKAAIGQGLINVFTPLLGIINTLLSKIATVANAFKALTDLLTGRKEGASSVPKISGGGYSEAASGAQSLADATNNVVGATKKAREEQKRFLAGFDEINKLSEPDPANGSSNVLAGSPIDYGELQQGDTVIDNMTESLQSILNYIEPLRNIDFSPLKASLQALQQSFRDIGTTIEESLEWAYFHILVPLASWTIEQLAPSSIDLFSAAIDLLNEVLNVLQPLGQWLWDGFLQPIASWAGDVFIESLESITDLLKDLSAVLSGDKTFGEFIFGLRPAQTALISIAASMAAIASAIHIIGATKALGDLTGFFRNVTNLTASGSLGKLAEIIAIVTTGAGNLSEALNLVYGTAATVAAGIGATIGGSVLAVTNFLSMLSEGFSWVKESLMLLGIGIAAVGAIILGAPAMVAGIVAAIVAAAATLVTLVVNYADQIKAGLNQFSEWLKGVFCRDWTEVFGPGLGTSLNMFVGIVSGVLSGLKEMFFGLIDFIQGVFTGNWEQAWNGIKDIVKGAINGVIGIINGMISAVVNGVNAVFRLLSFNIPLPSGGSIGWTVPQFTVPQIPYLAKGAVIPPNAPFMAMLGDQRHGTNIEAPLSTIEEAVAKVTASAEQIALLREQNRLLQAILENSGVYLDGKKLSEAVTKYQRQRSRALGV